MGWIETILMFRSDVGQWNMLFNIRRRGFLEVTSMVFRNDPKSARKNSKI
jgi:hypothetical protein